YIPGKIPLQAWFIIITELGERFTYYGVTLMFIPYLTKVLDQSKASASAINRGFQFLSFLTTVIGAVVADVYLGKFKAIILSSTFYFVGLILLALSAINPSLEAGFGLPGFCLAIFLFMAWGAGGIKANVNTFTAEQIPLGDKPTDNPNKMISYDLTVERVFRFFYWSVNVGSLLGPLVCPPVVKAFDYSIGFAIPCVIFIVTNFFFIMGKVFLKYKQVELKGNPIIKVIKVLKYCLNNRNQKNNEGKEYEHWLDKAKNQFNEIDNQFIDDLKRTFNACKVFLFFSIYWALNYNTSDSFILMGLTMESPSWLSAEQLNLFNSITIIILIPIMDFFVFPILRKFGFKLGPITRITIGFFICFLAFIYMTVLQKIVYSTGPYYDFTNLNGVKDPVNQISVWYQVPGYLLLAISEVFSATTVLEYSYQYASPELKSVVSSLYYLSVCISSLIGMLLAIWSYDPNYVPLFAAQTVVMGICTIVFYLMF
ncbi:PTR2-domain-containing protein, partial [Neoconidiobolus thromboides FSU 785]